MARQGNIDRRLVTLSLGALALNGCAAGARPVLVNLAGQGPPQAAPGDTTLDTEADASLRMTVAVRINGAGPYEFVVDTGANRTVICSELAADLGLPLDGVTQVHGVSGVETSPTAIVDLLEVDTVTYRALRAPAIPRGRLGADGLLGVDVLQGRRVVMDFVRRQLRISRGRGAAGDRSSFEMRQSGTGLSALDLGRRIVVPARFRFGQLIIIGADVTGRRVTAFVDTGSQSTVGNGALRRLVYGVERYPKPVMFRVPVLSATGQTSEGELGEMPLLKIGGLTITNLTAVFADLHVFDLWDLAKQPSLLLGMDVIRQFAAIELDYARREVAFYLRDGKL